METEKGAEKVVVSPKDASTTEQPKPPEVLTDEKLQSVLALERDKLSRQFQSVKDREIAQLRRDYEERLKQAETIAAPDLSNLDEDTRSRIELLQLRKRDQYYRQREEEENRRRQVEQYGQRIQESLRNHLVTLEIDPSDKRLDWGTEETDPIKGRAIFDNSVAKILKENKRNMEKTLQDQIKDETRKLRQELGLDTVDTSTAGAEVGKVFTKAQISDRKFWDENKKEILKAQQEGRIKE